MRARQRPVHLSEIVARLEQEGLLIKKPEADVRIDAIADDSRHVTPGALFCAWAGTTADGHRYIPAALESGAVAILAERAGLDSIAPRIIATDGRRAAAVAASVFYNDPQEEMVLVGITGTNGKTTTAWLLRHLLSARWPAASLGTLGAVLEKGQRVSGTDTLTTPGPVELTATLRALHKRGVRALAMEVSSHALAQGRVHSLRFDAAAFTNLSRDHLDYHQTLEAYHEAKLTLTDLLRADGWAVFNADDKAWAGVRERAPRGLSFGIHAKADVRARALEVDERGAHFRLETPAGAVPASLPLLGAFNVQNALAAAAVCVALGMDAREIAAQLETVPQVPGRLERISEVPCPVLRDYAHTPDALERALGALRPLTEGKLIVVFGAGGDRDRGKRPLMGTVAQEGADVAIVTSDNPRTEEPDAIIDEIVAGMQEGHLRVTDRRDAIALALDMAKPGDIVLLAGKGHETYQIIGTDKLAFDEAEVVRSVLAETRGARV